MHRECTNRFLAICAPTILLLCLGTLLSSCGYSSRSYSAITPPLPPPTLNAILVLPPNAAITVGATQQFTATGIYNDGTRQDLTNVVGWSSSNTSVASINNALVQPGLATAVTAGATLITASLTGIKGTANLTVLPPVQVVSIVVTPANPIVGVKRTQPFVAIATYSDGTTKDITVTATWNSATTTIATIDASGIATGIAIGTTGITAKSGAVTSNTVILTVANFAYAVNFTDRSTPTAGTISQYIISADGSLIAMSPASLPTGFNPYSLTIDTSGKYLYAANFIIPGNSAGTVSQFFINSDGSLAPMTPATIATGNGPNDIAVNPNGGFAYVANYGAGGPGGISQYTIGTTGSLAPVTAAPTAPTQMGPASIALNPAGPFPAGTFAYLANFNSNSVSQYSVANGLLNPLSTPVASGAQPNWIVVDPSGRFVYTANSQDNTVSQYGIGVGGLLTARVPATVATGLTPRSITVDATTTNAYVTNRYDNTVGHYHINTDGTLTLVDSANTGAAGPSALAFDPKGHFAYVTNRGSQTIPGLISQFAVDATSGSLTPLPIPTVAAGDNPVAIVTSR